MESIKAPGPKGFLAPNQQHVHYRRLKSGEPRLPIAGIVHLTSPADSTVA
jgi:hypothetical protein